jgi:hypothetical protein
MNKALDNGSADSDAILTSARVAGPDAIESATIGGRRVIPIGDAGPDSPPSDASQPGDDSPVDRLLKGARRTRKYRKEGARLYRRMEIELRNTPYPGVPFRAWPKEEDYFEAAILRPATAGGRKDLYIVHDDIAGLPYVASKVREGLCIPCITSTGKLFVWAMSLSDGTDRGGNKVFKALEDVARAARTRYVSINWENNDLVLEEPLEPIDEPEWPSGQSLKEIYYLAFKDNFITTADHDEIKRLNTRVARRFDTKSNKG